MTMFHLSRDMSAEVAGHVGVHVAEAVEGAEGEVEDEASQDGQHSRPPTPLDLVSQQRHVSSLGFSF